MLFVLLMLGLWLSFAVNLLPDKYKATVFGAVIPLKNDSTVAWTNGTAQKQYERNLIDQCVLRTYLLRLRNQYQYTLFGKINAHNIYQFNDYFFRFYSYNFNEDLNFIGAEKLQTKVFHLKQLQELLGDSTPIVTLIMPSKPRYFKAHLPERHHIKTTKTNYNYLKNYLKKYKLHFIDFNRYFINHRTVSPAIFAKGGTHWTHYAATVAMDSLVNYIAAIKHKQYNHFTYKTVYRNGFNVDDLDIALLRNLFTKPRDTNLRDVIVHSKKDHKRIKAVIVSDSYFLAIQNSGARKCVFTDNSDFHYYFKKTFDENHIAHKINYEKIKKQLKNVDCVILITGIINIEKFGFGFPEKMISLLKTD